MKLVLDTNVLLSAVLVPGTCRELLKGQALLHDWFTSSELVAELAEKLAGKLGLAPERTPFFLVYQRRARLVSPLPLPARVYGRSDRIVPGRGGRRIGVSAASPRRTSLNCWSAIRIWNWTRSGASAPASGLAVWRN